MKNISLQWELHAAGSQISFRASRDEDRYDLVVRRDDAVVLADVAKDCATLLEKSSRLRTHLQQLGYSATPLAEQNSQLTGGLCWGPAKPMALTLVHALG